MTTHVLRCAGVTKDYTLAGRRVAALRGADLDIESPGFYAIMGQSGSGKSTLLHLLAALDRPDAGTIEVAGRAIQDLAEREANRFRQRGIGIVFQQFNLIPTLTARENVELPGMLAGERRVWLRERSGALLARLGVEGRADHRPDALSGGEQQRVAIARALLFAPPLLLADEPSGNLDSQSAESLWSLLEELAGDGMTVVMVTHEPAAAAHCREVFVLRDGRVVGRFAPTVVKGGRGGAVVAARYQQLVRTE
ncbi:MAG: ABC transporter ATP-binding protein [Phycisphaerales bacterium]|nr:ABC transporter ATP-binding protein [Phycisphaerales bacterium]